jgi:hypothetical protein
MIENLIYKKRKHLVIESLSLTMSTADRLVNESKIHVIDEILFEYRNLQNGKLNEAAKLKGFN